MNHAPRLAIRDALRNATNCVRGNSSQDPEPISHAQNVEANLFQDIRHRTGCRLSVSTPDDGGEQATVNSLATSLSGKQQAMA